MWAPTGPAIVGVGVSALPADSTYQTGDIIYSHLIYREKVTVTGTPQLTLVIGAHKRKVNYSRSWSQFFNNLLPPAQQLLVVFPYTVRANDFDGDGIAIPADALSLNGGTIQAVANSADAKLNLGTNAIRSGDARSVEMRVRDTQPTFSQSASAANRSFALNVATSTTLPAATGGDGRVTYSVSPALPSGLALGSTNPSVTGTPTVSGATTHTLTATDGDGDRATLGPFTVTVAAVNAPKPTNLTIQNRPSDGDYATGEVIWAIVSFNKAVTVTGTPQLALTIGANTRQAPFKRSSSDGNDKSFEYTVMASDFDGDGIGIGDAALMLNGGRIVDASASTVDAALDLSAHVISGTGPTVNDTQPSFGSTTVSAQNYPTSTAVDESLPVPTGGDGTLRYSLAPSLPTGLSFDATQHRIHGTPTTRTASATYTYTATDGDGDAASLSFSLAVTTVPAVSAVTVSSSPASGDAYGALETISVDVRFDQAVTVTSPDPSLAFTFGTTASTTTRSAALASKPNASTLRFSYQVQASDDDDDGISVAADALTLNSTGKLRDATNTRNANLSLGSYAITNASAHKVDTPPKISGVAITSRPTDGNYAAGDEISVRLTFTEPVFVRSKPPTVALTIGTYTRTATWHSGSASEPIHNFTYTVQSSDFDGDGISIAAGAVTAGPVTDIQTGFWSTLQTADPYRRAQVGLGSHAITNDSNHRVRDTSPAFSAAVAAQHYLVGTAASLTLPTATGDGSISYELTSTLPGGLTYNSTTRSVSGTPVAAATASEQTWVATDGDGDKTTLTFTITVAAADAPKVSALIFISSPRSNNTYVFGEDISVGLKFDKAVTVGTLRPWPRLALTIGAQTRYASYISLIASGHLVFTYTVLAGDLDTDGISIGASALSLNGGSIVQSSDASVAASLALGSFAVTNNSAHKVNGGTNDAPSVSSVNLQSTPVISDGYAAGEVIRLSVGFTEDLVVNGSPRLAIDIGDSTRQTTFDRVAGLRTLHFRYTVQTSDDDDDGISVAAGALTLPTGATIRDLYGEDATLSLGSHALADQSAHKVHTPPKVTGLSIASTPQQANTYTRSGTITARVTFDQKVTVAGSPELALTIGSYTRTATAAAGGRQRLCRFQLYRGGRGRGHRWHRHRRGRADPADRRDHPGCGRRRRGAGSQQLRLNPLRSD